MFFWLFLVSTVKLRVTLCRTCRRVALFQRSIYPLFFYCCTCLQASNAADLVLRRATRQAVVRARDLLRPPPPPFPFLPRLPALPLPIPDSVVDAMSPRLTPEEVRGSQRPLALIFLLRDAISKDNARLTFVCVCLCVPPPPLSTLCRFVLSSCGLCMSVFRVFLRDFFVLSFV